MLGVVSKDGISAETIRRSVMVVQPTAIVTRTKAGITRQAVKVLHLNQSLQTPKLQMKLAMSRKMVHISTVNITANSPSDSRQDTAPR